MKIVVAAKHITAAKCGDPRHCMIAEAIRDSLPNVAYVSVRTNGITVTQRRKGGSSVRSHFMVPLKAARAIIRFDAGDKVLPFSFEPKVVDKKELLPRTADQRKADRERQKAKRVRMKVQNKAEIWRQRISGV